MKDPSKPFLDFLYYIESLPVTETTEGEFIAQLKSDIGLPNARCWKELKEYFDNYPWGVSDEAYTYIKKIWKKYLRLYPAYLQPKP